MNRLLKALAALALSALGHAAIFGAPVALRRARTPPEPVALARRAELADRAARLALPVGVAADRRALVEGARADRAAGRLALGAFLIDASAIDAREERRRFDATRARALYAGRVEALRAAPAGEVRRAVAEIFGDLHYYGRAGGSMGDALLDGGGSCEPLSHLLAAAVHDAGYPERARLRFYGGEGQGGATHLAPVFPEGGDEHDLLTGGAARRSGSLFDAEDLVEAYARAHDLAPPIAARGGAPAVGGSATAGEDRHATMASGYPPNDDRFPGATPLYAGRAVQAPAAREGAAAPTPSVDVADCAFFVRVAALDPPALGIAGPAEAFAVELRRAPTAGQMERTFALIQAAEQSVAAPGVDPAERLMGLACLAALYDTAAVGLTLASEGALAQVAAERGHVAAAAGEAALAGVDWSDPAGRRLLLRLTERYAGRNWLLLLLRGGDAPVLRLAANASKDDWGRINALAALLVAPGTRPAAVAMVEGLTHRQQIEVMHEVFHAHDHLRPWSSNYALDGAGEGEFARAYRVFRGIAWGLWEGARPAGEGLDALLRDASRERLGRAWEATLLEYYGRNALELHRHRADGAAVAWALKRWLREHGYTDLDLYRSALADVTEPT
jgi:hypothetical protein